MMIDLSRLAEPFPPEWVSWRVGSTTGDKKKGMALCYIDARVVMERLDAVCGVGGWQNDYPHADIKTVCRIGIKIGDEWVWKSDGAGDSDIEAAKGALSDSFKRAGARWGIGRYLYDVPSPWVALEAAGKSYKIAEHEYKRLESLLRGINGYQAPKVEHEPENETADNYLRFSKAKIDEFVTADKLEEWWQSLDRKKAFETFGLSNAQKIEIKELVANRHAALKAELLRAG